jgi:hypothetical protein
LYLFLEKRRNWYHTQHHLAGARQVCQRDPKTVPKFSARITRGNNVIDVMQASHCIEITMRGPTSDSSIQSIDIALAKQCDVMH